MIKEIKAFNIEKIFFLSEKKSIVKKVIQKSSFVFNTGISYAITGESGAGKSTLIHMLAGLDKPTTGKIFYDDRDIYTLSSEEKSYIRAHDIGIVFQQAYYIKELTIIETA